MKLLWIADQIPNLAKDHLESFQYKSIQIDFILLDSRESLEKIITKLESTRYHLILATIQTEFLTEDVRNQDLVNAVNNYLGLGLEKDLEMLTQKISTSPPPFVVNQTTAYFNVFLEIQKAVSVTKENETLLPDLKRIDLVNSNNYFLAFIFAHFRAQYYILNYSGSFPNSQITDILDKID